MADFSPPGERRSAAGSPAGQPGPVVSQQTHSAPAGDRHPNGASSDRSTRSPLQGATRPPMRQAYAAIDLGTNNCRLLIARPADANFAVIDAFSHVVRLGEGLASNGALSQAAMDWTVGALKICADKLRRRNVRLA